jgi:hypothetical protein
MGTILQSHVFCVGNDNFDDLFFHTSTIYILDELDILCRISINIPCSLFNIKILDGRGAENDRLDLKRKRTRFFVRISDKFPDISDLYNFSSSRKLRSFRLLQALLLKR